MTQVLTAYPIDIRGDALAGVRRRRLFAWAFDVVVVGVLAAAVWTLLFFATLGLSWFFLPHMFPLVGFLYYGLTVSGSGRGTFGMRLFGLQAVLFENGGRAPFINAAAHFLLFYLCWAFPLLFAFTLIDSDKRYLHDVLSGIVLTRRPS